VGTLAGGIAVLGASGTAFVLLDRHERWIRKILRRSLPGYELDPAGLALFIDEYNTGTSLGLKFQVFAAAESFVDAKAALPEGAAGAAEQEERKILSDFLIGSDFFDHYPDGPKRITYRGAPQACISPFATF